MYVEVGPGTTAGRAHFRIAGDDGVICGARDDGRVVEEGLRRRLEELELVVNGGIALVGIGGLLLVGTAHFSWLGAGTECVLDNGEGNDCRGDHFGCMKH